MFSEKCECQCKAGDPIKRFILERAAISLKLAAGAFCVPFLLSLLALGRKNGYMLLLMVAGLAAAAFLIFMLPCIRFAKMIRDQEKKGYPFEPGEVRFLSKGISATYLGAEWLILAGSVALHYTQCRHIRVTPGIFSRLRYSISVETVDGRIYSWPLSRRNVKRVQAWLEQKNSGSCTTI